MVRDSRETDPHLDNSKGTGEIVVNPVDIIEVVIDIFCYGLGVLAVVSWLSMIYFGAIDRGTNT